MNFGHHVLVVCRWCHCLRILAVVSQRPDSWDNGRNVSSRSRAADRQQRLLVTVKKKRASHIHTWQQQSANTGWSVLHRGSSNETASARPSRSRQGTRTMGHPPTATQRGRPSGRSRTRRSAWASRARRATATRRAMAAAGTGIGATRWPTATTTTTTSSSTTNNNNYNKSTARVTACGSTSRPTGCTAAGTFPTGCPRHIVTEGASSTLCVWRRHQDTWPALRPLTTRTRSWIRLWPDSSSSSRPHIINNNHNTRSRRNP